MRGPTLHWCCLRALPGESAPAGLKLLAMAYCRLVHRLKITGEKTSQRPLRALGCDLKPHRRFGSRLLQLGIQRPWIRWMMADDMRMPLLEPFLNWMDNICGPIPPFPHALISAVRHLRAGGRLGFFLKAGFPNRPRNPPFLPVSVYGRQIKARVLVAIVDGTPHTHELGQDLFTRSTPPSTWLGSWTLGPPQRQMRSLCGSGEVGGSQWLAGQRSCKWPWPGQMGFDRPWGKPFWWSRINS